MVGKPKKALGILSLTIMIVLSVDSIRNLPANALFGSSIIFFFTVSAVLFLIPMALTSSELAALHPRSSDSGVYDWVKTAFGPNLGSMIIWLQWAKSIIFYPTILSFIAGTIGYIISPQLVENKYFLISCIYIIFLLITIINLFGIKYSSWFSNFCGIIGLLLPMLFIILLGFLWIIQGNTLQITFKFSNMIPDIGNLQNWVALTTIMLSFAGIEIAAVHAPDIHDLKYSFPLATLLAAFIIFITLLGGAFSLAIVLPANEISLIAGIMQGLEKFLSAYRLSWLLPILAIFLVLGGIGSISSWSIASSRGLLLAAQDGCFPAFLSIQNKAKAPQNILLLQVFLVLGLSTAFLLLPTINSAYWVLTMISVSGCMLSYLFVFAAVIRLRYRKDIHFQGFKIPGGKIGVWLVGGAGFIGALLTFIVSFIPSKHVRVVNIINYEILLFGGLMIMCLPAIFFNGITLFKKMQKNTITHQI